jgi:hypothetical protein
MQTKATIQPAGSPVAECITEAASFAGRPAPATTALATLLLWGNAVTAAQRMPAPARPSACEGRASRAGLRRGTPARRARGR